MSSSPQTSHSHVLESGALHDLVDHAIRELLNQVTPGFGFNFILYLHRDSRNCFQMAQSIMARTGGVLVTPSLGLSPSISSQRTACILRRGQTPLLRRQSHSQTRMLAAKVPMVEISFETAEGNQTMSVESGDILRDVMMNPPSGAKVWFTILPVPHYRHVSLIASSYKSTV